MSVEEMVRELYARQQIHDAILRFCRGVDHGDEALARSAFHDDAQDDHGVFRGRAADFAKLGCEMASRLETLTHLICNEHVEFDGSDLQRAYAETALIACMLTKSGGGYRLTLAGCRYLDRVEERRGEWRISDRKVVVDWERDDSVLGLAGGPMSAAMLRGFASERDPSCAFGLHPERSEAIVGTFARVGDA